MRNQEMGRWEEGTVIIRFLRMIQFNVRNSILVIIMNLILRKPES